MGLSRLRGRLPLVVFVLLLLVALMLLGFACACLSDHPVQAIERALHALAALPAVTAVWSPLAAVVFGLMLVGATQARVATTLTPAYLQRFRS